MAPLDPEIVALPEFKVLADRVLPPPEKWHYVRIGQMEFLSNASERSTRRFISEYRDFQNALSIVSPEFLLRTELPASVILCANSRVFDVFKSEKATRGRRHFATALLSDQEIAAIAIDLRSQLAEPMRDLTWIEDVFTPASLGEQLINHSEELYREYIQLVLSRQYPTLPAWFSEGVAQIFGSMDISGKWIQFAQKGVFLEPRYETVPSFGRAGNFGFDGFGNPMDGMHGMYGAMGGMSGMMGMGGMGNFNGFDSGSSVRVMPAYIMGLDKLFAFDPAQPRDRGDITDLSQWSRQAATLVHMCLYGEKGKYRKGIVQYVSRAMSGPVSEKDFVECLGMNYKQMAMRLRSYTEWARYDYFGWKANPGSSFLVKDKIEVRPATDAEVGRIKGEAFRLAGLDDEARQEFAQAYMRGERDPQLLASLGLMARQRGDNARARSYLEIVDRQPGPVPRPRAYLELARLRSEEIHQKQGDTPLTAQQTAQLLKPLFVARSLSPVLAEVYLAIAEVWEQTGTTPRRDNLAVLTEGVERFPRFAELAYRAAAMHAKHGFRPDAAMLVDHGLKIARDPAMREKFQKLKEQLDVAPAPTTNATPTAPAAPTNQL